MPVEGINMAYSQAGYYNNYISKLDKDLPKHCSNCPNLCSICATMKKKSIIYEFPGV